MPEEFINQVISSLAKRFVRVSLLFLALLATVPVCVALYIERHINAAETHLINLDIATQHCWRVEYQRDYMNNFKIANPQLVVPDPVQTESVFKVMNAHGTPGPSQRRQQNGESE